MNKTEKPNSGLEPIDGSDQRDQRLEALADAMFSETQPQEAQPSSTTRPYLTKEQPKSAGFSVEVPHDIFSSENLPARVAYTNSPPEKVEEAPTTKYLFQSGVLEKTEELTEVLRKAEKQDWNDIFKFPTNRETIRNTPTPTITENFYSSVAG